MKEYLYYPGCTLKSTAKVFEDTAIDVLKKLDIELKELPRWNCCGTVHSLATDDIMHQLASVRNLIRAQEMQKEVENNKLVTLCSMCYNTLKRTNLLVKEDKEKLENANLFMDEEEDYEGNIEVIQLLELLKDEIGFDKIKESIKKPLKGLKVAPYYGCLLLRPKEAAIDNNDNPTIMEEFLKVLGADVVEFPLKNECCGSYHTVGKKEIVMKRTEKLVDNAVKNGADAIVLSCPLCDFNIDRRQLDVLEKRPAFKTLPTVYITELLALALDIKYTNTSSYISQETILKKIKEGE